MLPILLFTAGVLLTGLPTAGLAAPSRYSSPPAHPYQSGDIVPPVPGSSGLIAVSNVNSANLLLTWTRAMDNVSPQPLLQYEVRMSTSNNIGSVSTAEANGTIVLAYTADLATVSVSSLSPATAYFFNVIVKDEAGNKAAYATAAVTTAAGLVLTLETAANGGGVVIGGQSIPSGFGITLFAIQRDGLGRFVANVAAAWSLSSLSGRVSSGDLVPAGDNKSAFFTGRLAGAARISAVTGGLTAQSGTITVVPGGPASVTVESAANGTGGIVGAHQIVSGTSLAVFAIQRDVSGNFIANTPALWQLTSITGGVTANDLTPAGDDRSALFTGRALGSARITVSADSMGASTGTLTVSPGLAGVLTIETAANGSGTVIGAQNFTSGSSFSAFAVHRDPAGNFIANIPASWSLTGVTGGITSGDLVAAGDSKSALFTARAVGSATVTASAGGLTRNSGSLTVIPGPPAALHVETAANGSGTIVASQSVPAGSNLTVFAIRRDASNNFIANVPAAWSLTNLSGGVQTGDLLPSGDNRSAVFIGRAAGSARIAASGGGSVGTSGTLTVVSIDTLPPAVSLTTPLHGTAVSGQQVIVAAAASDNVGVVGIQFRIDGNDLGGEVTTPPFSIVWNTTIVSNGSHSLSAVARDAAGNQATSPAVAVFVNNSDTIPPFVSITQPANGASVSGKTVTVAVDASDNVFIAGVQFIVDGIRTGAEVTRPPYSMVWDTTTVANGTHSLHAVARDPAGNASTAQITVDVVNASPTLTYVVPPLGAFAAPTTSTLGSQIEVTHARTERSTAETAGTLAGFAVISLRSAGILVSESGVPATPPITSGRIYAETRGVVSTGVALSNPAPQDAIISFYFTDASGTNFGSGAFTLRAHQQVAAFLNQAPFHGPSQMHGTFTFSSTVPIGAIALRGFTNERQEFLITTLPVAVLNSEQWADMLPHFADGGGWTTQVVLTNATDARLTGTVQFFGQGSAGQAAPLLSMTVNGTSRSTFDYSIAPRSMAVLASAGAAANVQVGSVRIRPATGTAPVSGRDLPVAAAILSFRNQSVTVSEAGVLGLPASSVFSIYVEAAGIFGQPGSLQSGVAIANPSPFSLTVTLELTRMDGTPAGLPPQQLSVPAGGQLTAFIHQFFPGLSENFRGIVRLTSSSSITVTALRGRYNERGDFLITTTPPLGAPAPSSGSLVVPHIVSGAGYETQIILFGLGGSGRLFLHGQDGILKSPAAAVTPR